MRKRAREIGFILFRGKSKIDGSPIVCIATMKTANRKTGGMIQTWIIPADVDPLTAVQTNKNDGVCGGCPLQGTGNGKGKPTDDRVCYVNLGQAPKQIYRSFRAGRYPRYDRRIHRQYFVGRDIRWGAYGDPAAIPITTIEYFATVCNRHTGYSHQLFDLSRRAADRLAQFVMCSCHTPAMHLSAVQRGWRTFTALVDKRFATNEQLECPNYSHGITCEQCMLCDGTSGGARNIYAIAHGKVAANLPKHIN